MKKTAVLMAISTGLLLILHTSVIQAQFLKKIINTVKNTAENKANDKAAQGTNQVLDNVTNSMNSKPNSNTTKTNGGQADTAATNRVFGAFADAAAQNPNDTSAADLTMKALGILTGGGGISSADSAAAIQSFSSANGGAGYYYETTNTVTTQKGTVKSISKTWFTLSGEARVEINLAAMMGLSGAKPMVGISRISKPNYSLILDDDDKTYSLNIIDTALINSGDKYAVAKIGNETIGGYSCVHLKLTSKGRDNFDMDIWTSNNVPGYSIMEKMMVSSKSMITPDMFKALQQAGGEGYFVKIEIKNKDVASEMILSKVEQNKFPSSLFAIPAGYTEATYNGVIGNMMKNAQNQK